MQRTPSHLRSPLPKLPPQRTSHQFTLKAFLLSVTLAGPIIALLVNHESALSSTYRYALLFFAVFPRNGFGLIAKFVIAGVVAFGIVPYCFSKLHPLFAWFACVLFGFGVLLIWRFALDGIVWHHAVDERSSSMHSYVKKILVDDPQSRMMVDCELAIAATFILVGIIVGGIVSLRSREFS